MGKGSRSPLLGYNHNVRYRGRIYHVQSEDSGPSKPRIFTHLFYEGTILGSMRQDYDAEAPEDYVRALMQGQHKGILKELKQAIYDDRIRDFFERRHEEPFLDQVGDAVGDPALDPSASASLSSAVAAALQTAPAVSEATLPSGPPVLEPEPIPAAEPGSRLLDLDALPPVEPTHAPSEPLPTPAVRPDLRPAVPPGPGVYSMRGGAQERPFAPGRPMPPTPAPDRPPSFEDDPVKPQVVVIRPPPDRRIVTRTPPPPPPSSGGVVVQRTVVVGVGTPGPTPFQARPRRPRPGVPYVVKEGSHPIVPNSARVAPPVPDPRSPAPTGAQNAPTIPNAAMPNGGAPGAPPAGPNGPAISDRSLDEVILAYLSQDDEG